MTKINFKLGGTLEVVDEPLGYVLVTVQYDRFTITVKGNEAMAYKLPNDMVCNVQVAYVDAKGYPAMVDGEVTWSSSDENIATVDADGNDSTIARVTPGDSIGQCQITATADADLGEGTQELVTFMDVEVIGGEAVAGTITPVGEPGPIATPKGR